MHRGKFANQLNSVDMQILLVETVYKGKGDVYLNGLLKMANSF